MPKRPPLYQGPAGLATTKDNLPDASRRQHPAERPRVCTTAANRKSCLGGGLACRHHDRSQKNLRKLPGRGEALQRPRARMPTQDVGSRDRKTRAAHKVLYAHAAPRAWGIVGYSQDRGLVMGSRRRWAYSWDCSGWSVAGETCSLRAVGKPGPPMVCVRAGQRNERAATRRNARR